MLRTLSGIAGRTLGSGRAFSSQFPNQHEDQQGKCTRQLKKEQKGRRPAQAKEGNITRQNFWKSLESFKAHLCAADFVGFDLELSGIHSTPAFKPSEEATSSPLSQSYRRIKHLATKFTVLQVGLALFHFDPACNRFLAHPYNFYVFPRNELFLGLPATTFSCEASALGFLAAHGFDFNLCIQDGISYLSKAQESEARVQLVNEQVPFTIKSCGCLRGCNSTSDVVFAERLRVDLEKWHGKIKTFSLDANCDGSDLAADIFNLTLEDGCSIKDFKVPFNGVLNNCPSLTLQLENHHQVCLARWVLDEHFKELVAAVRSDCVSGDSHHVMIFFTKSKGSLDTIKNELEQGCTQAKLNQAIGFRHIVDAIVASRKPLIGHNCALDLAHIHDKFLSPLPSSAEEFSASLLAHFPTIIDTKYLLKFFPSFQSSPKKRHAALNALYTSLCKPKDIIWKSSKAHIEIMSSLKRYQDGSRKLVHEAGYDAYMTGCVFAQVCHRLRVNVKDLLRNVEDASIASQVEDLTNKLSFGRRVLDLRTGQLREPGGRLKYSEQIPSKLFCQSLKVSCPSMSA